MAIHMEAQPVQPQSPDMSHSTAGATEGGESPLHEASSIRLRAIIVFFVWFFIGLVAIKISVYAIYRVFLHEAAKTSVPITGLVGDVAHSIPPEPRLQPSLDHKSLPKEDLAAMRERDLAEFRRRGWVDDKTGEIKIDEKTLAKVLQLSQPAPRRVP